LFIFGIISLSVLSLFALISKERTDSKVFSLIEKVYADVPDLGINIVYTGDGDGGDSY
jgi:hypothetical protein